MVTPNEDVDAAKRAVRSEMRRMRRALPDRADRSARLWAYVEGLDVVVGAEIVLAFASIEGEPETGSFIDWCDAHGKTVLLPESQPLPDPMRIDVVIVPGLAFTPDGRRLGQGGGWYDRFLLRLRPGTPTIGVGFEPQLVAELPTGPHDVGLTLVVTDAGPASGPPGGWSKSS